jgi:hypothetical protein
LQGRHGDDVETKVPPFITEVQAKAKTIKDTEDYQDQDYDLRQVSEIEAPPRPKFSRCVSDI